MSTKTQIDTGPWFEVADDDALIAALPQVVERAKAAGLTNLSVPGLVR